MSLYTQWMTVLLMMMSGLALGLVYDSYRVVAGQFKFPRWTLPFLDVLYWLAATLFVFQMLVKGNQGELRFYVFLGLACGAWLYAVVLSKMTVAVVMWLVKAIKAIVRFVLRCLYVLIILPLKAIWLFTKGFILFLKSVAMFLIKIVLQCLRPLALLVLWAFRPLVMPVWNRFGMTERMLRTGQTLKLTAHRITAWMNRGIQFIGRVLHPKNKQ
ncbi:spore cortex biosynthesis protein YabQ [Paenibacillus sp. MER TA 81-3]|uniref:spore cortex biosynthesis protein YabQ n=1 Tax=Paenibacillus sp. MER TA 81-3 TaxID=2939573 RepID=UPI00203F20D0|nr:spore cortex biosynthesis protein YabQ [Paenibacillus sp. MER TA 81-3]MCM3342281.1 spore cortex biosynthesis protein YabQ [Paenibacillus sp. MER TA 81-3]